jgi:transcriptional regulator with XRE-family HTH domain
MRPKVLNFQNDGHEAVGRLSPDEPWVSWRDQKEMPKHSSAVDKHVGARLRAARVEAGKSQTQVAEALGVSFQQIQKYEKGTNRISAGALHETSQLFHKPVQYFFDGLHGTVAGHRVSKDDLGVDPLTRFGGTSEGMKIVMAFEKADPLLRRILAQHVEDVVRLANR